MRNDCTVCKHRVDGKCSKASYNEYGNKTASTCCIDGGLPNLFKITTANTYSYEEVLQMYKEAVKDYKTLYIKGRDYVSNWYFQLEQKKEGRRFSHEVGHQEYIRVPATKTNVHNKMKQFKTQLNRFKDLIGD